MSENEEFFKEIDQRFKQFQAINRENINAMNASIAAAEERMKGNGNQSQDKPVGEPWQPLSPQELYQARISGSEAWEHHLDEVAKEWN